MSMWHTYPTTEEEFETRQAEFKRSLPDEYVFYRSVLARVEHQEIYFREHMDLLYMDLMIIIDCPEIKRSAWITLIHSIISQFHNYLIVYRELREYIIDSPMINDLNCIGQLLTDQTAGRIVHHLSYDNICKFATRSPQILQIFEDRAIEMFSSEPAASSWTIPYEMRRLAVFVWRTTQPAGLLKK